jgi:hypothetical protein
MSACCLRVYAKSPGFAMDGDFHCQGEEGWLGMETRDSGAEKLWKCRVIG